MIEKGKRSQKPLSHQRRNPMDMHQFNQTLKTGRTIISIGSLGAVFLLLAAQGAFAQHVPENIRTSVTLRSDHTEYTKPGDVITLSGEIAPSTSLPHSWLLHMRVQHPDSSFAYDGDIWTDDFGRYELPVTVMESGYIRAEVSFGDMYIDYRNSSSEMIIPIRHETGMAIVVAGGGESNPLFPMIEYVSDLAVHTLTWRYFSDEAGDPNRNRIIYLHPDTSRDIDGDGEPDVDGEPNVANLTWAIETWAAGLIQTKDSSGNLWPEGVLNTPLTVYLVGDITSGYFLVRESELIDGTTLDFYLDALEQSILNQFIVAGVEPPQYLPINVIVEAPSSGDFIAPVSQQGRVVITSTCAGCNNYMNQAGSVSFSAYFLNCIAGGQYIHPSFAYSQYYILSNPTLPGQEPQLEATGNGIANEIADEMLTASMPLEVRPIADARPRLLNGLGHITLRNIPAANLWVYVDDPEDSIAAVEVTIIPPEESFEESHIVTMTEHATVQNRWEGVYDKFYGEGTYTIIYTAIDVSGNVAIPIVKTIIVEDTQPPLDVTNLRVTAAFDETVVLRWSSSESPDTQGYRIYVTPPNGGEYFWGDPGNVHEARVTGLDIFGSPGVHTFRVTAYDRVPLESLGVTTVPEIQNQPPVAIAGTDQAAHPGMMVTLDGSASSDPDENYPLSYAWEITFKPGGSIATLSDPTLANPSFTADKLGNYTIQLVVTDSLGAASPPDEVVVSTYNSAPVADAGPDQAVIEIGTTVQLDGTESWDPDGDLMAYQWTITTMAADSLATLDDSTSATPTFVADVRGEYVVELVVSDWWVSSAPDTVTVSFENVKPLADAGVNQSVLVGDTVYLDGSGSHDANHDPLTYSWSIVSKPEGSMAALSDTTSVQTSFVADLAGTYVASLVVNDGFEDSDPSNVTVVATSTQDQAVEDLNDAMDAINGLNPGVLKNANMQNTLTNKIIAVLEKIDQGLYQEALNKLKHDILARTNGCAEAGFPDRNDWIETCEAQSQVYPIIMEVIELLRETI